jgi:hypothetical protein
MCFSLFIWWCYIFVYIDIFILMAIHIKYIACFYLFPKYYYISLFVQLLNSDWFAFLLLGSFFRIYILVIILTSNNLSLIYTRILHYRLSSK